MQDNLVFLKELYKLYKPRRILDYWQQGVNFSVGSKTFLKTVIGNKAFIFPVGTNTRLKNCPYVPAGNNLP
jgi:hypothetical protein